MKIGTGIMKAIMRGLSALPLGFHYACCGFFSWLLKDVFRYRRDVVMTNLARSFPDKKYNELKETADRFYKHFGRLIAETIWFGGCRNPERLHKQRLVEYSNIDVFDEAYRESKGLVVLYSHLGNWELMGGCASYDYREGGHLPEGLEPNDVVFVYKPLKSEMWDEIMRENRCAPVLRDGYTSYVSSEKILRFAIQNRDRKLVVNINSDQCPYSNSTVDETVDFMHQKTKTMLGGASIASKFGWCVLYASMIPTRKGNYEWKFTEICRDASAMTPCDIMQEYYRLLQTDIEACPWCYLWTHKRWKK